MLDDEQRLRALAEHAERIRLEDFDADLPRWLATVTSLDEQVWVGGTREGRPASALAVLFAEPGR